VRSFAQTEELNAFRSAVVFFVNYDRGKVDSVPRNESNTALYGDRRQNAFLAFVLHPDSKNLDTLKEKAIQYPGIYELNGVSYSFFDGRQNFLEKSLENNVNHRITFCGIYDYGLPNFVAMTIQPFIRRGQEYVVYSYSLNGEGNYLVKEVSGNSITFESTSTTSDPPILKFQSIDSDHILLVEDLGDHGQMAFVLNTATVPWTRVNAFRGLGFDEGSVDYSKLLPFDKRPFLRVASNRSMTVGYGKQVEEISFNEETKTISYTQPIGSSKEEHKVIQAQWNREMFALDDYYLGQYLEDEPPPHPMD